MSDSQELANKAAALLNSSWISGAKIDKLPSDLCPSDRQDGYKISDALALLRSERVIGWKLDWLRILQGPFESTGEPVIGRLFESRVVPDGACVSLVDNHLRVGKLEFGFRIGYDLPSQGRMYSLTEIMNSVASLHLAIEIPNSRFLRYPNITVPLFIADNAGADWLVLSEAVQADWRNFDLADYPVKALKNGSLGASGCGCIAHGDPRVAVTWLVNELCRLQGGVKLGTILTTGTCVDPVKVQPGDTLAADFGSFGQLQVKFQ